MGYEYLRLHRPASGTTITVESPIVVVGCLNEQVFQYLNSWASHHYPDFEISDFWTKDQKKMSEVGLTQEV